MNYSLSDILRDATQNGWAVPHFNFTTLDQLAAVVEACRELRSPAMIGTSEGERSFIGMPQALALVRSYQKEEVPIFLNADHTRSVESAKEAIDAGYNSIHIDLSKESYKDNLSGTKEVVTYARQTERDVSVEGEVGYLPTESSTVLKETVEIDPASLTKPARAEEFVKQTGVNRLAPAVGNLHGIAANEPQLDFERIKKIRSHLSDEVALVLHGGSGIDTESFKRAISLGFANVHISTEIRRAWRNMLKDTLGKKEDEYAPYRLLKEARGAVKQVVAEKIKIFGSSDKY